MRKRIELGARVRAKDGEVGTVDTIIVDPEGREPSYLLVKQGRFRPRWVVVPVSLVTDTSSDEIALATTAHALEGFPDYKIGKWHKPATVDAPQPIATYTPPAKDGYIILHDSRDPEARARVERGMDVLDAAGLKVGQVYELLLGSDGRHVSTIALEQERPQKPRYRRIPADLVAGVRAGEACTESGRSVHLRIAADYVYGLQVYWPSTAPDTKVSIEQGATVVASDGEKVGAVHGLILDSDTQQVSHIVSRLREPLASPRDLAIPVEQVANVRIGQVHLHITTDEVFELDVNRPVEEEPPPIESLYRHKSRRGTS